MSTCIINPLPRPGDPLVAEVLRRLLARAPDSFDPWLPFPQNGCSFKFGRPPRPSQSLPIGALWRLWDSGFPFCAPCPSCDATLRMVSMGGLLTIGGGRLVCPACSGGYFCSIGNLSTVGALVSERLRGTEFRPAGFVFGGSVGSDGAELLAALGLSPLWEPEDGVVRRADGARTRVGFEVPESVSDDAVRVRRTEGPDSNGIARSSTVVSASGGVIRRCLGSLRRRWTERKREFVSPLLWPHLVLVLLLGCLMLWGAWSAWDEGRLGAALGSAAIGTGMLLLGSALLAGGSERAVLFLVGAGGLFVLVGFVFLSGMFAGDPDSVRPIELGWAPWAIYVRRRVWTK